MRELAATTPPLSLDNPPGWFEPERFFEGIHWHQQWEMFEGVYTPGRNPVAELLDYTGVPRDLRGKAVLDVGAWNGGFTFECARRGASRVVGFGPDDPDVTGFNKIKKLFDLGHVDYVHGSIYDVHELGSFDIVLLFGVLYHLRHPLLALDNLHRVVGGELYVESFVCDEHFVLGPGRQPTAIGRVDSRLADVPIWQFYQRDELRGDSSNWFGPNLCGLKAAVRSSGFEIFHDYQWSDRAALAARKVSDPFDGVNAYEKLRVVADSVSSRSRTDGR